MVQNLDSRVRDLGIQVHGTWFEFTVHFSGFRVQASGFRVQGATTAFQEGISVPTVTVSAGVISFAEEGGVRTRGGLLLAFGFSVSGLRFRV